MLDSLTRQKERIDEMIRNYQNMPQQTPVNNFITAAQPQTPQKDMVEWRVLNENEEVDNLYVGNKTLFIGDNLMILKGVEGSLQKWEIRKVYPIDKKDQKINDLEEEIRKLKEMISNESTKSIEPVRECKQSDDNVDGNAEPKSKANGKSISK